MGLRRAIKAAGIDVDDLREAAAAATETDKPELAKLRRVTWGTLLQLGLLVLAAYAVLSFFSGVDFGDLRGRSARCVVALADRRGASSPSFPA